MSPGRPFVSLSQFVQNVRLALAMLRPAKRLLTCILVPLLLSPLPLFFRTKEASCAYVVMIMACFWLTEALPLAVTALVPVFAFPLLSIDTASRVSSVYLSDSNFVFFGSMIMAVAVESSRLHERIALNVLMLTGPNPRWLMLGFQLATAFLSMWISNTATTMMMVPIVVAVIKELDLCHRRESDPLAEPLPDEGGKIVDLDTVSTRQLNIYKGLLLSICFAASIGGTGTLIGTGSNVVLNAYLQKAYAGQSPVTFASFMFYAVPQALFLLFICWLWLQLLFVRSARPSAHRHQMNLASDENGIGHLLVKKHQALGPLRYEEKTILTTFGILIFLWLTRQPVVVPGWGNLFPKGFVSDGTAAMAVSLLLFVLPADNPFTSDAFTEPLVVRSAGGGVQPQQQQLRTVMTWRLMGDKFSWSTLLLLGGGYAMADGVESSGLSDWIGARLTSLETLPDWVFIACACLLVTFLTEFSSNVATASIFIPMVASIARANRTNPLVYVLPVCFSSSFAFMFPAGTPPNAIVFAVKVLRVGDMMLGGLALNVAAFVLSQVLNHSYAHVIFDLYSSPFSNGTDF
ncbi:hypothetical protein niasHS_004045 [Heterodera schachtii]|uniref:Uncharacterized protein n=1 Tax=Heterodera schachtii TaxID=97005 RepID=A0ABD2JUL3_HETSC